MPRDKRQPAGYNKPRRVRTRASRHDPVASTRLGIGQKQFDDLEWSPTQLFRNGIAGVSGRIVNHNDMQPNCTTISAKSPNAAWSGNVTHRRSARRSFFSTLWSSPRERLRGRPLGRKSALHAFCTTHSSIGGLVSTSTLGHLAFEHPFGSRMESKRMPETPRLSCGQTKLGSADAMCSVFEGIGPTHMGRAA